MKQKDVNDLRNKTVAELEVLADKTRQELTRAKMDMAMHRSKNTNVASKLRKNLAQMLTVKKELSKPIKK